jgi:lipoate-protein ligase B
MDLTPFSYINPCGYKNLSITQLIDLLDYKQKKEKLMQISSKKIVDYFASIHPDKMEIKKSYTKWNSDDS